MCSQPNCTFVDRCALIFLSIHIFLMRTKFLSIHIFLIFLPSAIRRMGESNIFSLFTLAGGGGGTPSQVWVGGGGYPTSGLGRGGTQFQVQGGGGTQTWDWVTPPPQTRSGLDKHSEYLLRGGRCASCVHAGALSCLFINVIN